MAKTKKSAKGGELTARPKANTKAKVTKPARAAPTRVSDRAKKAAERKAAAIGAAAEKLAAAKLAAEKRAAKNPAPKKPAAKTPAKTAGRKRKDSDDEDPPAPAKRARVSKAAPKMPAKSTTKEPAAKKPAAKKPYTKTPANTTGRNRKANDDEDSPVPAKKAREPAARKPAEPKVKLLKKGPVINEPPTQRLKAFVMGEVSFGELGLGTVEGGLRALHPRLNPNLSCKDIIVTQMAAGGMHGVALTLDNQIFTWGINDEGTLGRDTKWEGVDDPDSNGTNPRESFPGPVDWSKTELAPGTRFVQVTAGDATSWVLTDDGKVYGWGVFRTNSGNWRFSKELEMAWRPVHVQGLKNIVHIEAGAQHVLAMDNKGLVFSWGSGEQMQLGRRVVSRTDVNSLMPQTFGLPKSAKNHMTSIAAGQYHSFAIANNGDVYGWGLNSINETGITDTVTLDESYVLKPQVVKALKGKVIVSIKGGSHHTLAATADGDCLVWGKNDNHQSGISDADLATLPDDVVYRENNRVRRIDVPQKVTAIQGAVKFVSTQTDNNIAITEDGRAWSWGSSETTALGHGDVESLEVATLINSKSVRDVQLTAGYVGAQFSMVSGPADDPAPADADVPVANGA